jgi:hypothetical protein
MTVIDTPSTIFTFHLKQWRFTWASNVLWSPGPFFQKDRFFKLRIIEFMGFSLWYSRPMGEVKIITYIMKRLNRVTKSRSIDVVHREQCPKSYN